VRDVTPRRTRWSFLSTRARVTLLGGLALFAVAMVLFAITDSEWWLLAAIVGFLLLRVITFVGVAASRKTRP